MNFNAQSIGLIIVGAVNLFLGCLIYLRGRKNQSNIFFALVAICVSAWTFSRVFFEIFPINGLIYFWVDFLYISASFIPLFFIFFTYVFPADKIYFSRKQIFFIVIPNLIIVLFVLIPDFVIGDINYDAGGYKIISFGSGYIFYFLYLISYFFWGFVNLIKKYFKKEGIIKTQLKYIFWGTFIATLFGISTNLILPIFGSFKFFWLGPVMTVIMTAFIAYAIIKHQLLDIKIIATELLVFSVWIFLLIRTLLAESWQERLIDGSLLVFVVFFGILIIRSVLKEVRHREEVEKLANELESANQKLKETDKVRAEMYSFVSHQIKAPIGIIKGFAQLLRDGSYGKIPKKAKETVVYIKTACDRLINLTEMFLNLRRIEEGKMDYEFKEINLIDLAESVFKELKLLADQKNLEFKFECGEKEIKAKVDEQRLRQVFQNLIENSIKYTKQGFVKVAIEVKSEKGIGNSVLFTVSDSGIGIKKEVLPEIFEQFKRAKEARQIQGTGLGLYVAREIVKAHGGEIWAESEGEGRGSRFYVKMFIERS